MRYYFEKCSLDTDRRELRRDSNLVPIEPQVFDLLSFLIQNRERVVSKDDLLAEIWLGRIVSESALTTRINAARSAIGDNGDEQRLIKTLLRKGFRFVGDVREESGRSAEGAVPESPNAEQPEPSNHRGPSAQGPVLPDKPSIAVLPFSNLSGDAEQEYFADGITEDLITALSQFRWLFVIARNSTFVFKGKAMDAKQIGRELGVRYLLEGSVRKSADRVRITGQLIEATTGSHLWANKFDGALADIFDLQDQLTTNVVGAIAPKLEQAEIERAKRKPTDNLDAYDYYLRGMASLHLGNRDSTSDALRLFYRAIEFDNEFASAFGMAAWCYDLRKWNGWMISPQHETDETERLARIATELGKDDAVALCTGGFALAHVVGDLDVGAACIDRALMLNPNLAAAWFFGGWVSSYLGQPDVGIDRIARAMRLNPLALFPFPAQSAIAWAHFVAGRYDEACVWGQKAVREQPNFLPALRIFAASCAMAGRSGEARTAIARVRELDPVFRITNVEGVTRLRRPGDLARYEDALRKAGLPE